MFSKLRSSSKNDLRSVFRSIFTSHASSSTTLGSPTKKKNNKNTLGRRIKARLSSFRLQRRLDSPVMIRESPERELKYNAITALDPNSELNITVSSILKKSSSSAKLSSNKKIRFTQNSKYLDDTTLDDSFVESDVANSTMLSETDNQISESDITYYKQLREELLERSREFEDKSTLKRKASSVSPFVPTSKNIRQKDKMKKLDESLDLTKSSSRVERHCSMDAIDEHEISTKSSPLNHPPKPIRSRSFFKEQSNQSSLKKCQSKDDDFHIEGLSSVKELFNQDPFEEFLYSSFDSNDSKFTGKITAKKNSLQRFNPISRSDSCGVTLLSEMKDNYSRMSWCAV